MLQPLRVGELVAYIGVDHPDDYVFEGQPGLVVDVGPTLNDVTVALASGPSLGVPAAELTTIGLDVYRIRAGRMREGRHPTRGEPIAGLGIADPLDGPADLPPDIAH